MKQDTLFSLVLLGSLVLSHTTSAFQPVSVTVAHHNHNHPLDHDLHFPHHIVSARFAPRPRCTLLRDAGAHFPGKSAEESSERNNAYNGQSPNQQQQQPSSSSNSNQSNPRRRTFQSLLRTVDEMGLGLKSRAVLANAKASLAESKSARFFYTVKSCACFALFILYRAYRGFFIIAPAVFRAARDKLETVVDEAPFEDRLYYSSSSTESLQNKNWKTRITVSVLAVIVTTSYLLGGAVRVVGKLIQSGLASRDGPRSWHDAAAEQERNEAKLLRLAAANQPPQQQQSKTTPMNGEGEGLAP